MPLRLDQEKDGHTGALLVWGEDGIEANTLEQAFKTARLPFVHSHLALMPDAHLGIGATVGSVIATSGAIVPAAVGVDIGCGMIAARTAYTASQLPDTLGPLHGAIRSGIPAGVGKGHERADWSAMPNELAGTLPLTVTLDERLRSKTVSQFGTLGSGNHFVELCTDEQEAVWLLLHSGSRGVGNELAKRHIDGAKGLMQKYWIELEDPDLAYFAEHTMEFASYISDMQWAQAYARENREAMLRAAALAFGKFMDPDCRAVELTERVNCHHNYTEREHHHNRDLWVTRKGAIRARTGDMGIIPGSMATGSYIVRGKGNPVSFTSASHGAGRRMSRGVARRTVTVDELETAMAGKAWNDRDAKTLLDEAPAAYKPIESVMAAQSDLVEVVHELHQVLNYKGT